MRDEMISLERYQKQFKFLYSNGIDKMSQLDNLKAEKEAEVEELIARRKSLYKEGERDEVAGINAQLKKLRSEVRMCKNITVDSIRIKERFDIANEIIKPQEKQRRKQHQGIEKICSEIEIFMGKISINI